MIYKPKGERSHSGWHEGVVRLDNDRFESALNAVLVKCEYTVIVEVGAGSLEERRKSPESCIRGRKGLAERGRHSIPSITLNPMDNEEAR